VHLAVSTVTSITDIPPKPTRRLGACDLPTNPLAGGPANDIDGTSMSLEQHRWSIHVVADGDGLGPEGRV
jgi:hypothetical protein